MSSRGSIFVEAPARLHFGVLDLAGRLGRHFGGLGAAIPCPSLLLEAAPASGLSAHGPDADRAIDFARRFLAFHGRPESGRLIVHKAIPSHAGLGSGTQLGLAVARALAEIHGLPSDPVGLALAVARGKRSAIGTWTFALGGFIVEGGRRIGTDSIAPLLARFEIPAGWRCVVAVPPGPRGLSGEAETAAFEQLKLAAGLVLLLVGLAMSLAACRSTAVTCATRRDREAASRSTRLPRRNRQPANTGCSTATGRRAWSAGGCCPEPSSVPA